MKHQMAYLSGVVSRALLASGELVRDDVGVMIQPGTKCYRKYDSGYGWAYDNGCFAESPEKPFVAEKWYRDLTKIDPEGCLFATAPDVVGDAAATWERSQEWLPKLRAAGLPAALVAQNGIDPESLDWDAFDVIFIGGDDEFKDGPVPVRLAELARQHGKRVHVGRVNTWERFFHCYLNIRADSVDGTMLLFGHLPRMLRWLNRVNRGEWFRGRKVDVASWKAAQS